MSLYHDYTEGHLTPQQALRALCSDLAEVESEIGPLERQREQIREQISLIVARMDGERADVPGFGTVRIASAAVTERWDGKALAMLMERLLADGQQDIASAILRCKEKSFRAGGLRVERSRG